MLMKLRNPLAILNRDLRLLFTSNFVGAFGDGLYSFLLPVYIQTSLKATPVEVGLLYTVLTLCASLTVMIGGVLADRIDRKKVMVFAWALWLPVPIIFSLATNWKMTIPAMIFYGCYFSSPALSAYIVASADRRFLAQTFTSISAAWWSGYVFSPSIGGFIASILGMKIVFWLAFFFYLTATIILLFIKSQLPPSTKSASEVRKSRINFKKLVFWMFFFAAIMFFNVLIRPYIPTFLQDNHGFDSFTIGILGSFMFAGSAVLGVMIGKIGDKMGIEKALLTCLFLAGASIYLLQTTNNFVILTAIFFFLGTTYTPWALMNATVSKFVPREIYGRWVAIFQTASMLSAFIAPYIGGVLYEISYSTPFNISAITSITFAFVMLIKLSLSHYWLGENVKS